MFQSGNKLGLFAFYDIIWSKFDRAVSDSVITHRSYARSSTKYPKWHSINVEYDELRIGIHPANCFRESKKPFEMEIPLMELFGSLLGLENFAT